MAHLDPYEELGHHIKRLGQGNRGPALVVGTVKSTSPLEVWIDKPSGETLKLLNDDLLVDDWLCPNVKRDQEYSWRCCHGSEGRFIRKVEYKEYLEPGDRVAVMACENTQLYLVLARVKKYGS